jgi:hypothetical protein
LIFSAGCEKRNIWLFGETGMVASRQYTETKKNEGLEKGLDNNSEEEFISCESGYRCNKRGKECGRSTLNYKEHQYFTGEVQYMHTEQKD